MAAKGHDGPDGHRTDGDDGTDDKTDGQRTTTTTARTADIYIYIYIYIYIHFCKYGIGTMLTSQRIDHKTTFPDTHRHVCHAIEISWIFPIVCEGSRT